MHTVPQNPLEQHDLPPELCVNPLALVGISGLDTVNNAVHKLIWEAFSNPRRAENVTVQFKLIGNAHEFPVIKPKRNSYDWYHPKGILKKNWMNKYLNEVPAVMAIFYDLDWTDGQWSEKMIECASRVQSMRAALDGRNTRLTVVLIQSSPPLPAGEDILATERSVALCASCEINSKSLFVLPHDDHMPGYVLRLETAFNELAQNFYHMEAKNVKSHRDHLNKTTHQYLFVRHQFKMGFLYELKQDNHTAHKHYTHAYNNLLEIRIVDTNAMEVRTVAGFVNYKLCKLMFALSLPKDAVSQFKAHFDRFRSRIGFQELAFEHYAWLCKQHSVFGDVFDEAVKSGLSAMQTQHPGIYYQQAAQYAILRKKSCHELCTHVTAYPQPDPLEGAQHLEFYGQRPWRPGKLTTEPPDPQMEVNGIRALQFLEKQINHSSLVISLYGLAIAQFKTYRCPRTRRFLVLQMADEYYNSRDYGKALTLLTHMLWDFRTEKWWDLLTDILVKALRCAYLVANVQDYLLLSLEILGNCVTAHPETKKRVYFNLNRLLKNQMPDSEAHLFQNDVENAVKLWKTTLDTDHLAVALDMSNIVTCIDCKAKFLQNKYEVDQSVFVELYVRNSAPYSLTFQRLAVTINTPDYSSEFAVTNEPLKNPNLEFRSGEVKRFLIEFTPDPNDVEKEMQIGWVNLLMGNGKTCTCDLKFNGGGGEGGRFSQEFVYLKRVKTGVGIDFEAIKALGTTQIIPRQSRLGVEFKHDAPALLGEWYSVTLDIFNKENFDLENVQVEFSLLDEDSSSVTFSATADLKEQSLPFTFDVVSLTLTQQQSLTFYLKCNKAEEKKFNVKISYKIGGEKLIACTREDTITVETVEPFQVDVKYLSALLQDVTKCYVGEDFAVMPILKCLSPWPILVENTAFEFISPIYSTEESITSQIAGLTLSNGESGTELYLAKTNKITDQITTFGTYQIQWKRLNGHVTTTELPVMGLIVDWVPLDIKIKLPAFGLVRTPLLTTYELHNRSSQLIQLEVSVDASEAFMFAGYKQFQISILPESTKILKYNLYPLITGSVALPRINLKIPENSTEGPALREEHLRQLIERSLPTHLFVMPQVKGSPKMAVNLESSVATAVKDLVK